MTLIAAIHPLLISLFIILAITSLVVYWEKKKLKDIEKRTKEKYPRVGKIRIYKEIEDTLDEFERKIS